MPGTAKRALALCAQAGVTMTRRARPSLRQGSARQQRPHRAVAAARRGAGAGNGGLLPLRAHGRARAARAVSRAGLGSAGAAPDRRAGGRRRRDPLHLRNRARPSAGQGASLPQTRLGALCRVAAQPPFPWEGAALHAGLSHLRRRLHSAGIFLLQRFFHPTEEKLCQPNRARRAARRRRLKS